MSNKHFEYYKSIYCGKNEGADSKHIKLSLEIDGVSTSCLIPVGSDLRESVKNLKPYFNIDPEIELAIIMRDKLHCPPEENKKGRCLGCGDEKEFFLPQGPLLTNLMLAAVVQRLFKKYKNKCECGAEKSSTTHSDWCPKHATQQ